MLTTRCWTFTTFRRSFDMCWSGSIGSRDLHFQTCTTIDTLDYSGSGLNEGSKVVMAAVGPKRRDLPSELPSDLRLPDTLRDPRLARCQACWIVDRPCIHRCRFSSAMGRSRTACAS